VEEGTALAARIGRGQITAPDDDAMADRYLIADEVLGAHGMTWYEISNWAASDAARCRHNLLYWTGGDWWGIGPGAHSHVGGTRWWNVKHPAAYAARIAAGRSPAQAREVLTWHRPAGRRRRTRSPAGWRQGPPMRRAGSSSPAGAACWPTPSSAT